MFINLVNQHQFDGEISIIKDFIVSNTDICNYEDLCYLLDDVYNGNEKYASEVQNNNVDFIHRYINNINRAKSIVLNIESKILNKKNDELVYLSLKVFHKLLVYFEQ